MAEQASRRRGSRNRDRSSLTSERNPTQQGAYQKTPWFNSDVEISTCRQVIKVLPTTFPVVHRGGAATLRMVVVDRRPDSILLCDASHPGDHVWPNGDLAASGPPGANSHEDMDE